MFICDKRNVQNNPPPPPKRLLVTKSICQSSLISEFVDFGKGKNSGEKSNFWVSENSKLSTSPKIPVRFASSILSENLSDIVWDELRSILPRNNFLLDFFQVSPSGNTGPERKALTLVIREVTFSRFHLT